jgi:hypothetical protein
MSSAVIGGWGGGSGLCTLCGEGVPAEGAPEGAREEEEEEAGRAEGGGGGGCGWGEDDATARWAEGGGGGGCGWGEDEPAGWALETGEGRWKRHSSRFSCSSELTYLRAKRCAAGVRPRCGGVSTQSPPQRV